MIDPERFAQARERALEQSLRKGGIGTLGEKVLHATLKYYLASDPADHEQKIGSYYADICTGEQIFEIQTRQFNKLRHKLQAFLPAYRVTVVYPIPARKWVLWIDPHSGEVSKPRLSPKRGTPYDVFYELYKIKPWLDHPNFSLLLLLIDLEEYKLLNGWSHNKKRGSTRHDRLPLDLIQDVLFSGPGDYSQLIPEALPESFTSADFARVAALPVNRARTVLNVLCSLGQIEPAGKQGRLKAYLRTGRSVLS